MQSLHWGVCWDAHGQGVEDSVWLQSEAAELSRNCKELTLVQLKRCRGVVGPRGGDESPSQGRAHVRQGSPVPRLLERKLSTGEGWGCH